MTKMALDIADVAYVVGPGAALGLGGAGLGYLIDMLAGTKRRWTTILGLLGLVGGAGAGGLRRYLSKRETTTTPLKTIKTQLLWFAKETEKPGDELVQERYPNNEDRQKARESWNRRPPIDIFNELVGDTTQKGWVWSYYPSKDDVLKYRLARSLPNNWRRNIPNIAREVALRAMLLTLYKDKITPELRERIEDDFQKYVEAMRQHIVSDTSANWDKARQQINKITNTLIKNGHSDIANLFDDPLWVYWL
jgi:hypothetical protein